jgi:FlaA1/EpsC-like NDP-sugar epimerase
MHALQWDTFLGRAPLMLDRSQTKSALQGKRILITGAGGSIGSALSRALVEFAPRQLILLEAAEHSLYAIDAALASELALVPVLGSVTQPVLLEEIFARYHPQVVYHAAAFKHVPLLEQNPFAAIENNALGTSLLVGAALAAGAEQLILLTTDKAADPVSMMGASKRIAELVVLAAGGKAVRLGNVLGSEGSIVPLFLRQIAAGIPLTVTHPLVQRYFLTMGDAVTLLLHAASVGQGVLVPDLGEPITVESLARYLIKSMASANTIAFTQLRPGDKMCEALLSAEESYAGEDALLRTVKSPSLPPVEIEEVLLQLRQACQERSREKLLQAVLRAVPQYQPGELIRSSMEQTA